MNITKGSTLVRKGYCLESFNDYSNIIAYDSKYLLMYFNQYNFQQNHEEYVPSLGVSISNGHKKEVRPLRTKLLRIKLLKNNLIFSSSRNLIFAYNNYALNALTEMLSVRLL